jgi:hypothetical protein
MALQRRQLKDPLAQSTHPCQLGLFDQRGLTAGAVEASQNAVAAELVRGASPAPPTRFPARAGCALCCTCDKCISPLVSTPARRA